MASRFPTRKAPRKVEGAQKAVEQPWNERRTLGGCHNARADETVAKVDGVSASAKAV